MSDLNNDIEEVIYSEGEEFIRDLYPDNTWDSYDSINKRLSI